MIPFHSASVSGDKQSFFYFVFADSTYVLFSLTDILRTLSP